MAQNENARHEKNQEEIQRGLLGVSALSFFFSFSSLLFFTPNATAASTNYWLTCTSLEGAASEQTHVKLAADPARSCTRRRASSSAFWARPLPSRSVRLSIDQRNAQFTRPIFEGIKEKRKKERKKEE